MRNVVRLMALELRLFLREPMTAVFVLVLPLVMMYVLDGVFGNEAQPEVYEGLGASTSTSHLRRPVRRDDRHRVLPVHLAGYHEKGVLKRFRASALPVPTILAGHLGLGVVLALASVTALVVVALVAFDIDPPAAMAPLVVGTVVVSLAFTALGLVLGLLAPSPRAAQGLGVLLFFLFLILGGSGPPMEVMPSTLVTVGEWLPMTYAEQLLRGLWVGGTWPMRSSVVLGGMLLASAAAAWLLARFR